MLFAIIYWAVAILGLRFTVRSLLSSKPVGGKYMGPRDGVALAAVFFWSVFLVGLWPLWYAFLAVYGLGTQNWEKVLAGTPKSVREERKLSQEKRRKKEHLAMLKANSLKSLELGVISREEYEAEQSDLRKESLKELGIDI